MATTAAAGHVTQPGGSFAHSRPPMAKFAILANAALPSPVPAAFCQHGGAPQANRRPHRHKMLNVADTSRIPARHLGGNFLNPANLNPSRNKTTFPVFYFQL